MTVLRKRPNGSGAHEGYENTPSCVKIRLERLRAVRVIASFSASLSVFSLGMPHIKEGMAAFADRSGIPSENELTS
jgi:hypothetical protein